MKIVEWLHVGIQHVSRAVYDSNVEFPITRERLYVWSDGEKKSPCIWIGSDAGPERHLMDMTL